ncbi:MAG: GTP 3',8-cyclase MoaA [Planctomycetaceae bacterium]|nr:GTP 3',8-cyclase MoaA [Planctomycetaceae bacterium]
MPSHPDNFADRQAEPLADSLGRVHTSLRISVTDRCNIRCFYCMPDEQIQFKAREELLSFEEIESLVRAVVPLGINRLRITGGEPLVRASLPELISRLAAIPGIRDLAMTTNGVLLSEHAEALAQAGLQRLNVSLDGLSEKTFQQITRRKGLDRVLSGIESARQAGFDRIRLNAVAIRGISEQEIVPLGEFARETGLELRFIEFMPLDAEGNWKTDQVLSGNTIRELLEAAYGPLQALPRPDPSQPAVDFAFSDGLGRIGFINPVSQPFCQDCNRLRVTAEGQLRNCLFSMQEWDARKLLRNQAKTAEIQHLVRECVANKKPGHGIDSDDFQRPERAMYQIGG